MTKHLSKPEAQDDQSLVGTLADVEQQLADLEALAKPLKEEKEKLRAAILTRLVENDVDKISHASGVTVSVTRTTKLQITDEAELIKSLEELRLAETMTEIVPEERHVKADTFTAWAKKAEAAWPLLKGVDITNKPSLRVSGLKAQTKRT